MPSSVAVNWSAYCTAANAVRKRLADGTFSGFIGGEAAAVADLAVGLTEKNSNPLSLLLDAYSNPREGAMFEKSYVTPGSLVGG